jgi:hypothetical protein
MAWAGDGNLSTRVVVKRLVTTLEVNQGRIGGLTSVIKAEGCREMGFVVFFPVFGAMRLQRLGEVCEGMS